MESDFSKSSEKDLVQFITDIFDIEEVPSAIRELRKRNSELAMQLSKDILENDLGDQYLQAIIVHYVFDWDNQYVLNFFIKNLDHLDYYVFGEITHCFGIEVYQPFGRLITKDIIKKVEEKYNSYSPEQRRKIDNSFKWFADSYLVGIELKPEIKKVLTEMNFIKRYEQLSDKYHRDNDDPHVMQDDDIKKVIKIFSEMGYEAKYDKREMLFELNAEEYPEKKCKIWCNVCIIYSNVKFVWMVYHNNDVRLALSVKDFSRLLINLDYIIPDPRYRSYEELEEIFKAEFSLFDDFKERVLKEYE